MKSDKRIRTAQSGSTCTHYMKDHEKAPESNFSDTEDRTGIHVLLEESITRKVGMPKVHCPIHRETKHQMVLESPSIILLGQLSLLTAHRCPSKHTAVQQNQPKAGFPASSYYIRLPAPPQAPFQLLIKQEKLCRNRMATTGHRWRGHMFTTGYQERCCTLCDPQAPKF